MAYVKKTWVDDETPIMASDLNHIENQIETNTNDIAGKQDILTAGSIIYSGDISATGNYNFTSSGENYRFLLVELTTSTATVRTFCLIPGPMIMTDNSMYISFNPGDSVVIWARISIFNNSINVVSLSSNAHIRSIRGII